jgi:hypothetical protein
MPDFSNCTVYKLIVTNPATGSILNYIGSTTNHARRMIGHKFYSAHPDHSGACPMNQVIANFGGWDNCVEATVLEEGAFVDKAALWAAERRFIEELKPELNRNIPGRSEAEYKRTDEYQAKSKAKYAEKQADPEYRARCSAGWRTDEYRARQNAYKRERYTNDPVYRAAVLAKQNSARSA